jgi:two-component system repressor protein LuxO
LLLVDQDESGALALADELAGTLMATPELTLVSSGRAACEALRAEAYDIVLFDLSSIGDISGQTEEAVTRLVRLAKGALLVAIAGGSSISGAVAAMRAGAHDYLSRPVSGAMLATRLAELAQRHGRTGAVDMRDAAAEGPRGFAGFIGGSNAMQYVYEQIGRISPSSAPVFITGESGTGKEVCAEALHALGPRSASPFIPVNCAAIPRDLMESELFGVVRGAFTGAHEDRRGAAEAADGGTLFLDEIGEMDLSLQAKLLRFLQTGCISRVGESVARKVDVRVVCATNRNPMQLITANAFREDLFYRLHVLPIHLPPLRQRPADIMSLAEHFLERFAGEERKAFRRFDGEAAETLVAQDWPGNVRQLQNMVRRIVVMFDGETVTARMVMGADLEYRGRPASARPAAVDGQAKGSAHVLPMWQQEQRIIEDAIAAFNGNISLAAAALEISPSTIYRKRQSWSNAA